MITPATSPARGGGRGAVSFKESADGRCGTRAVTGLFNSSLEGNARRAIDPHGGETINENAFEAPILKAIALDGSKAR
jgi:hypothetical protein